MPPKSKSRKKGKKPQRHSGFPPISGKARAFYSQAIQFKQQGRWQAAIDCYQQAIAASPDFADAHVGLGIGLANLGQIQAAIAAYQEGLRLNPDHVEAYNNVAVLLKGLGSLEEAVTCYQKAIRLRPQLAPLHYNLANALKSKGDFDQAIRAYQQAVHLAPKELLFWQEFACSLEGVSLSSLDQGLMQDLIQCFSINGINKDGLVFAACHFLHQLPEFIELFHLTEAAGWSELQQRIETGAIIPALTHPLLIGLMKSIRIQSVAIEKLLTEVRRLILSLSIQQRLADNIQSTLFPFLSALAGQCHLNEYVYFETDDETDWIQRLHHRLETMPDVGIDHLKFCTALLAAYQPLGHLKSTTVYSNFDRIGQLGDCQDLLNTQVKEPAWESTRIPHIPKLTSIRDATSAMVRDQYESNPYPRWKESRYIRALGGLGTSIYAKFPHLPQAFFSNPPNPEILIAGCGTGRQAVECAQTFPNARILAIDLSLASLAYALRKAKEKRLSNIEFKQGDILELDQLETCFDLIESVGVLHHLKDPLEGWRILTQRLKTGGYMKIGLYSKAARARFLPVKEYIRRNEFSATTSGIRRFRKNMMTDPSHAFMASLVTLIDFYSVSEIRDLLFHVQEHQFSLVQIGEMIDRLQLTFLGFELNPAVVNNFRKKNPEPAALTDLTKWHEFEEENPACFISMYQFWLQKKHRKAS